MIKFSEKQIADIASELECGNTCFINLDSGEIRNIFNVEEEFGETELDYIEKNWTNYTEISPMESRESFSIMQDFVESLEDGQVKTSLIQVLDGRRPFANFKHRIHSSTAERELWFHFKSQAYIKYTVSTLECEKNIAIEKKSETPIFESANLKTEPFAQAAMLIRKPVKEVFQAIIDPEIITKFWFTKSSGPLKEGKSVTWTWSKLKHTEVILAREIVLNEKIVIQWGDDPQSLVEWIFKPLNADQTFVDITNTGFDGSPKEILSKVRDATEGFTLVLAGMKAFLEHGIQLNLVGDRYPKVD